MVGLRTLSTLLAISGLLESFGHGPNCRGEAWREDRWGRGQARRPNQGGHRRGGANGRQVTSSAFIWSILRRLGIICSHEWRHWRSVVRTRGVVRFVCSFPWRHRLTFDYIPDVVLAHSKKIELRLRHLCSALIFFFFFWSVFIFDLYQYWTFGRLAYSEPEDYRSSQNPIK